jgi:hypothetical protein
MQHIQTALKQQTLKYKYKMEYKKYNNCWLIKVVLIVYCFVGAFVYIYIYVYVTQQDALYRDKIPSLCLLKR